MFYRCKNESRTLEVCGRENFHIRVCILASASQQIPGLSRTFNLKFPTLLRTKIIFQDFPGQEIKKNPGLSRRREKSFDKFKCMTVTF